MRKVILASAMSLDGCVARENGDVDWLQMGDLTEAKEEMREFFSSIDAIFFGRKTYEKGLEMSGGKDYYGDAVTSYVFTRTPRASDRKNLQYVSANVGNFVENLKQSEGKNILLMGGGDLAKTFFEEHLIDELILGIQPTILGAGLPLFLPCDRQSDLKLIDVKTRKSGSVQITYQVK